MNILFLDIDPKMCAYAHCDEDVNQKILVYTKLLTAAHYSLDPKGKILESLDPLSDQPEESWWAEATNSNYQWLHDLWFWLHKEYWYRYDAMHDDWSKFYNKLSHVPKNITEGEFTAPPGHAKVAEVLEDEIQNSIETSRQSYIKECKENDAKWGGIVENMRTPPSWILEYANV